MLVPIMCLFLAISYHRGKEWQLNLQFAGANYVSVFGNTISQGYGMKIEYSILRESEHLFAQNAGAHFCLFFMMLMFEGVQNNNWFSTRKSLGSHWKRTYKARAWILDKSLWGIRKAILLKQNQTSPEKSSVFFAHRSLDDIMKCLCRIVLCTRGQLQNHCNGGHLENIQTQTCDNHDSFSLSKLSEACM